MSLEDFEFEIACDFGDGRHETVTVGVHDDPAKWALFKDHECGAPVSLACERCKHIRYDLDGVIYCHGCGQYVNAKVYYRRVERIR